MTTIALIGANGQVGSEVALLLSVMQGVTVVPVVRTRLGAALLERCGLTCRIGSLSSDQAAKNLLAGCDLVVDFSLPNGLPAERHRGTRSNIAKCMKCAAPDAPYVFISSTMAFGMPGSSERYRNYLVARTQYASDKRYGERWTYLLGRLHRRPAYVLRLGHVMGELQAGSRGLIEGATRRPLSLEGGESMSGAVFCSTIALALRNIANGLETPGTYTLLEAPEWTHRQLYAFHMQQAGITPNFVTEREGSSSFPWAEAHRRVINTLASPVVGWVARHKELLVAHVLPRSDALEKRIQARFALWRAGSEIQDVSTREMVTVKCCLGPVPGARLKSVSHSWTTMQREMRKVQELLKARLGPESYNFSRLGAVG